MRIVDSNNELKSFTYRGHNIEIPNFYPNVNRLLVKPFKPSAKTKGGLFIPETQKVHTNKMNELDALLLDVYRGVVTNAPADSKYKVGDAILFQKYSANILLVNNDDMKTYFIVHEDGIFGTIEEEFDGTPINYRDESKE